MYNKMKKQILNEEFKRMQKLAGIIVENENVIPSSNIPEIFASYNDDKDDLKTKFARTMSEFLHLLEHFYGKTSVDNLTIDSLFDSEMGDVEDGDEFYAGPSEVSSIFQSLPDKFIISNDIDGNKESFKIIKTGEDEFSAELIN